MPIEPDKAERVSELRVPLPKLVQYAKCVHPVIDLKEHASVTIVD